MTSEQRKALRTLARAVRDGEEALEVIREAKLDTVKPVVSLAKKLRELRKVNERRQVLMREVRAELVFAGVSELDRHSWTCTATVGAELLALVGK